MEASSSANIQIGELGKKTLTNKVKQYPEEIKHQTLNRLCLFKEFKLRQLNLMIIDLTQAIIIFRSFK